MNDFLVQVDIFTKILELGETIEESLNYTLEQVENLKYEQAFNMLMDTVIGIESIENALQPYEKELPENKIAGYLENLKEEINSVVNFYENKQQELLSEEIKEKLIPTYLDWQGEVVKVLQPYIIS